MSEKEQTIFNFSSAESTESWRSVDDSVMGGVSNSELKWRDQYASFEGVVSPENNGGFASVRSLLSNPLSANLEHLWIESKGDEKRYSMLVRTNKTPSGISYQSEFKPTSAFTRIELPLSDFVAQFRGRLIIDAPELTASDIVQIGIIISSGQYGSFLLEIKAIGVS